VNVEVLSVIRVEEEVSAAYSGDNIKLKLKGIEEEDISPGFVLCDPSSPCHMGQEFDAQIVILEHKSIICAGYSAVLHIHSVVEEVQIAVILPSSSCPSPPPPVSLALPSSFPPHTSFSSSSTLPSPEQYCICCIIYSIATDSTG